MSNRNQTIESLESRTLMSVTPMTTPNPLPGDRLAIQADLLAADSQAVASATTLLGDRQALKADHLGRNMTLQPLIHQFKVDAATYALTLKADRLSEASHADADRIIVTDEEEQMLMDKGNPSAESADKIVLHTDEAAVQQDYVNGLTQRTSDRNAEYTALFNDGQAIMAAYTAAGISMQAQTDLTTFIGDKTTAINTYTGDLGTIVTAREKLITDLMA